MCLLEHKISSPEAGEWGKAIFTSSPIHLDPRDLISTTKWKGEPLHKALTL